MTDFGSRARASRELMRHRVQDILLVSSLYDWFILSSDGQLDELILAEFVELNLRHAPGLTHVRTGEEALARLTSSTRFDLVITSMAIGDMDAVTLARRMRTHGCDTPIIVLAYSSDELSQFVRRATGSPIDRAFLWQGDARLLLAIVNYVEDRLNVAADTGEHGVQAVIVIEDSPRHYSSFLPAIYSELAHHSQAVAPEGVNRSQKLMRARARPKILLCTTFEEAWQYFWLYQQNILGVISDIEFPCGGRLEPEAGVDFARRVRALQPDVPVMLQSGNPGNEALARQVGAAFLLKESDVLLQELRRFMTEHFGFGDFVFRRADGTEVARARDLRELESALRVVPTESVAYHAERNHFSTWLKARTEFALAHSLRPRKVSDFATVDDLRQHLVGAISGYLERRNRTSIADFGHHTFDASATFYRIGGGSLGGKARGLAFVNLLLDEHGMRDRHRGVDITVPHAVVIGTDVFDEFLDTNGLRAIGIHGASDGEILGRFRRAAFPDALCRDLAAFLDRVPYPLAVRSSSLLEDSQYQPFAGIYETFMVPNNHWSRDVRLGHLLEAVTRVYASTFSQRAKVYLDTTPYRLEEEKMAVILQRIVGAPHGSRFYPDFSGVARSHNFYPIAPASHDDGIAAVALGLGMAVVDGDACVRFCPKYPRHIVQFSSIADIVQNSQREFFAVSLDHEPNRSAVGVFGLDAAEADGTLFHVGSTYSPENDAVYDGVSRPGVPLVSFAPILKSRLFPLAEIVSQLLELCVQGTSGAVEIEFAARLGGVHGREFAVLQLRPIAHARELVHIEIGEIDPQHLVCASPSVLGHGRVTGLQDVVVVDFHRFDRARSQDVALAVARFNALLTARRTPYVLIGVGRWGSREPLLGIPVTWDQISGARVIVESGFRDFRVAPSQGTHFFQNLTSTGTGYFTVNAEAGEGYVDWEWLAKQPESATTEYVRHLRFDRPLVVEMDGTRNRGIILKP